MAEVLSQDKPRRGRRIALRIFVMVALIFIGLQFTRPSLENPPVKSGHDLMATNPPPPEVAQLLRAACYDCHSSETRWPWYAHVAPVSNWVVRHIKEGRDALNFSEWRHDDAYMAADEIGRIAEVVQKQTMPLPSYTWLGMHPDAKLSEEERGRILKWAEQEQQRLAN